LALTYDIIIIGGRVAGASLAARLDQRVLLLERDVHPSRPAASSPVIYAPSMTLLDEIGADEAVYAAGTPKLRQWVIEAQDYWQVSQAVPDHLGRDYAYAVDRARFDAAIWDIAVARPNVDARQQVAICDLLLEGERVVGVVAKDLQTGETQSLRAPLVVGADGRFSIVARKTNATVTDEHTSQPTSAYYAYWREVRPLDKGPSMHLVSTGGDYGLLLMDSADELTVVVIEGRSDVVAPDAGESVSDFYMRWLREHPTVWDRLQDAQPITSVHGMKRVGNMYRQAGGPGWALVGDALHQKDPLDGQGIYDALLTAKYLSIAVDDWCKGTPWNVVLSRYEQSVRQETLPMYHATLERVNREIYTRRPGWFMRYPARWLYADAAYREQWARLFVRDVDPANWFSSPLVLRALARGLWRDLVRQGRS
jgi:2-polyprenyl-6-methoxyphenol hydroxylase-like FAD-dependent oxidoreductase